MTGSESCGGVVDAILQRYEDLSDAEKAVADFILTHKGTVPSLSAVEIARLSGISNTTVSRDHLLVNDFDFSHNSINYVLESLLLLLFHSSRDANEYNLELFNRTIASEREG